MSSASIGYSRVILVQSLNLRCRKGCVNGTPYVKNLVDFLTIYQGGLAFVSTDFECIKCSVFINAVDANIRTRGIGPGF